MRVITGSARGRRLRTLEGLDVRPTTDKVKEGIFSAIQFQVEGRRVLDLFAGSGQLGIEALSRGARNAVFVDQSDKAVAIINENIKTCGFESRSKVLRTDALYYIGSCTEMFDIIFLDPPYGSVALGQALALAAEVVAKTGVIICESDAKEELPENVGDFAKCKVYKYGRIAVTMYRRAERGA